MVGMGGSAARSLSFGKPLVVAGEAGWFKTFTPHTAAELFRNSFWSPDSMDDPVGSLVECLNSLLNDSQRRTDLGRFGRDFAEQNFGLPAMAKRLAHTYEAALSSYNFDRWCRDAALELEHARLRLMKEKNQLLAALKPGDSGHQLQRQESSS
jgi:hypothetical protein